MDRTYHLNGGFKPTLKRTADLDGPDFFPTPAWATHALISHEPFMGEIWEPACGDGAMSRVLEQTGNRVISSDLYDRGFGEIGHDFLTTDRACDNIVTNPPYNSAEGFVRSGLRSARRKLCLLLRLAFLEGANRHRTIFALTPPAACGSSASGSRSTFTALSRRAPERPRTPGSSGTRMRRAEPR